MNTARLTSRTGAGIAVVWAGIGSMTTLLAAWVSGSSMALGLLVVALLATIAGVALTNRLPHDGDEEETGERESESAPADDNGGKWTKAA